MSKKTKPLPQELLEAQLQFEHWRRTRTSRLISDDLWILAIGLAERYGLYPTIRALKLNSTTFKKRIAISQGLSPLPAKPKAPKPAPSQLQETANFDPPFLAVNPALHSPSPERNENSVELKTPNGAYMRIQWSRGESPPDLLALGQSLFGFQR